MNEIVNLPSRLFLDGTFFDTKGDIGMSVSSLSGFYFDADGNHVIAIICQLLCAGSRKEGMGCNQI